MHNRKNSHKLEDGEATEQESEHMTRKVAELLQLLHQKVMSSPVLNGGFDSMMLKVERIEGNQRRMGAKVNSIHEAIYHPDNGLFARVKDLEHTNERVKEKVAVTDKLERELARVQQKQELDDKDTAKVELLSGEHMKLVNEQEKRLEQHRTTIQDLVQFKMRVFATIKWVILAVAGGVASLIGKFVYDYIF